MEIDHTLEWWEKVEFCFCFLKPIFAIISLFCYTLYTKIEDENNEKEKNDSFNDLEATDEN